MSTSLFDQGWFSSLPSFWSAPGDDYDPAASSTTPSRSTFRQPNSKHTIVSTSSGKEGGQQADMPKVKGRKSNAQQKKNKAYTKKDVHPAERQTAPKPSSLSTTAPSSSAYPRAFYNDDLASSPLNAPRRSTVPLPQSYEDNPFFFAAAKGDSHSASASSVRSFVRPAVDDEHGQEQQQVRDVSLSASSGFTSNSTSVASTEFDYSGDDDEELEGVYEYASDAEDADIDDVDDERPFPSPQKAKQEKYFRRAADFGLYSPSSTASSPELHPVDANKAKSHAKGKGKALSAAASWADPSLLPPPIAPSSTHYSHPSAAAAPLITPSTAHGSYSKISHLNQLPAPTPTVTTLPPSPPAAALDAYYSPPASALESPSDKFPRGRNPHPRLLWRSLLDKEALAVLDAHHDRIVGGPLPRLAVVDASEEGVKFGASGIERERDHAGAREEGERGRSREERRFRAGGGRGRREWSVEGRRWSREVERCGL